MSNTTVMGNDAPVVAELRPPQLRPSPASYRWSCSLRTLPATLLAWPWSSARMRLGMTKHSGLGGLAAIAMGIQTDLQTTQWGVVHVLVWDSAAPVDPGDVHGPQGLGSGYCDGLRIRARACDNPEGLADAATAFDEHSQLHTDSQRCRLLRLLRRLAERRGSGCQQFTLTRRLWRQRRVATGEAITRATSFHGVTAISRAGQFAKKPMRPVSG